MAMNPERLSQTPDSSAEGADMYAEQLAEQREIFAALERTLSDEAMRMVNELALVDSWEEFNARVAILNGMDKKTQLNYADAAEELESETLESRQWSAALNFTRGWKLGVTRHTNGTYTFEARA